MKYVRLFAILAAFLISENISCQTSSGGIAGELEGMYSRIRQNISTSERLAINDSIKQIIENYTASDSVFKHRFSNLRYLGQITSPDSLVKIITWNLILQDGGNRYFCYIIRKPVNGEKNIVFKLSGIYNESAIKTDTTYSGSNWYGALYYDIRPFLLAGEPCYVLLGIDYGNSFVTRKIIDVLSFSQGGSLVFGKKCFSDGISVLSRVVFEYTSRAVMSLKFEADDLIVFDHLSPSSPDLKDNRQFYGPDFSFDSYRFEKGMWKLREDIDIRNKK